METEKDLQKVVKGFNFVTACEHIVAAWEYITSQLIEKCFLHATFINSVPTAPEPEWNIWGNMQQILNVQVPFSEYVTADDWVDITERLNDAHIVEKIKNWHKIQEEEDVDQIQMKMTMMMMIYMSYVLCAPSCSPYCIL